MSLAAALMDPQRSMACSKVICFSEKLKLSAACSEKLRFKTALLFFI
jgi:hypothetical protein